MLSDLQRYPTTVLATLGPVLFCFCSASCAPTLDELDREVAALAGLRTSELGGLRSPTRESAHRADQPDGVGTSKTLQTRNPSAAELSLTPAAETRDVEARLAAFGKQSLGAAEPLELDLDGVFRVSQTSAREYLSREEDYLVAAISLLIERHQWSPRLFNDTTFGFAGDGVQGRYEHAATVVNTLRATKRLPFGGEVEARWVTNWTENLRQRATGRYVQGSQVGVGITVPILRGAGTVAEESLIQAERALVYEAREFERFRREFLVAIASDYFSLLQFQAQIVNQERQLKSLRNFAEGTAARVAAGRIREFERAIAENQVLTATSSLASQREGYILAVDRFKVRLGLPLERPLIIKPPSFDLPEPEQTLEAATAAALEYRLDLQNTRDQLDDAKRAVANAKNRLLPDLDLRGDVAVPTSSNEGVGGVYLDPEDLNWSASATLSLPLDRRAEGLALRQSVIRLQQAERALSRDLDNAAVEARGALRNVDLARFRLNLAERAVEINRKRLEEQQIRIDQVDPQQVVDTENDLLTAENARDDAVRDLRVAILNYLLASDQLRVAADGTLAPLGQ
jgi:outer membrane protein TolC